MYFILKLETSGEQEKHRTPHKQYALKQSIKTWFQLFVVGIMKSTLKLRRRTFFIYSFFFIHVFQSTDLLKKNDIGRIWEPNSVCLLLVCCWPNSAPQPYHWLRECRCWTWSSQTHASFFCCIWNLTFVNSRYLFVRVMKSIRSLWKCSSAQVPITPANYILKEG